MHGRGGVVIRSYVWCAVCHQRAVPKAGDACPGCLGHLETLLLDPIVHPPARVRLSWWQKRAIRRRFLCAVKNYEPEILP
jgi:predicted RNA-binding protein with PUA domain